MRRGLVSPVRRIPPGRAGSGSVQCLGPDFGGWAPVGTGNLPTYVADSVQRTRWALWPPTLRMLPSPLPSFHQVKDYSGYFRAQRAQQPRGPLAPRERRTQPKTQLLPFGGLQIVAPSRGPESPAGHAARRRNGPGVEPGEAASRRPNATSHRTRGLAHGDHPTRAHPARRPAHELLGIAVSKRSRKSASRALGEVRKRQRPRSESAWPGPALPRDRP